MEKTAQLNAVPGFFFCLCGFQCPRTSISGAPNSVQCSTRTGSMFNPDRFNSIQFKVNSKSIQINPGWRKDQMALRCGQSGPGRARPGRDFSARPGKPPVRARPQFWWLRASLKKVFRSSSESRNHSNKEFHGLSVPFRHFRFNLLFARFWLITAE